MATRQLRIDFADLMGEPPQGFTAYLYVVRTDTTNEQAPVYTDTAIIPNEPIPIRPNADGIATTRLVPSAEFPVPTQYVLVVDRAEIPFLMPDEDTSLLQILTDAAPPPATGDDTNYYLAVSTAETFTDTALAALLVAGTVSRTKSPIASPTWAIGSRFLFFAQPASDPDVNSIIPLPSSTNELEFWQKRADDVTIESTAYSVWQTKLAVFQSASGRRYQISDGTNRAGRTGSGGTQPTPTTQASLVVQDDGTTVVAEAHTLNFTGAAEVTAGADGTANVAVTGGGGGGGGTSPTDLTAVPSRTAVVIQSSTGNDATIGAATATQAGAMTAADVVKLAGIETGATADQTAAEIKTEYESNADTNVFTDAEKTKLTGIEDGATGDLTDAEVKSKYEANAQTNAFTDTEKAKLAGIAANADVTPADAKRDATNAQRGLATAAQITKLDGIAAGATAGLTIQDGGTQEGTAGTVDTINYTGSGVSVTRSGNTVNVAVPGGTGGGGAATDLGVTRTATQVEISSSTGDNATILAADGANAGVQTSAQFTKLEGIETGATADQTAAEIKTAYESNSDTNAFTDAEETKLAGISANADVSLPDARRDATSSQRGLATSAQVTKLDGIETGAKDDQTASEIKTLYESNADTRAFTDADHTKLDGIETAATADQTAAEIKTAYESNADTNAFTDADHTKLDGVATGAIAGITVQKDGTTEGTAGTVTTINFSGAGSTVTRNGNNIEVAIPGGGGGGGTARASAMRTATPASAVTVTTPTPSATGGPSPWTTITSLTAITASEAGAVMLNAKFMGELQESPSGGGDRLEILVRIVRRRGSNDHVVVPGDLKYYGPRNLPANSGSTSTAFAESTQQGGGALSWADVAVAGDVYRTEAQIISQLTVDDATRGTRSMEFATDDNALQLVPLF